LRGFFCYYNNAIWKYLRLRLQIIIAEKYYSRFRRISLAKERVFFKTKTASWRIELASFDAPNTIQSQEYSRDGVSDSSLRICSWPT
jgi:hypothetical protein